MLRRAKRLQSIFNQFCDKYGHPQFKLDQTEWRQIDYLLQLTQPFFRFTTALSRTKDVTVHTIFSIYNKLFDHLETSISQLQRKKVQWKQSTLSALKAAKDKLSAYYSKTSQDHGYLYAMGTILAPQHKLQFFSDKAWSDNNYEWREKYVNYLRDYIKPYEQRVSNQLSGSGQQSQPIHRSEIEFLLASTESTSILNEKNEVTKYLDTG